MIKASQYFAACVISLGIGTIITLACVKLDARKHLVQLPERVMTEQACMKALAR